MLKITERAASALRSIVADQEPPPVVRLCEREDAAPGDASAPRSRLDLVSAPEPGDELMSAPDGSRLCLAPAIASALEDKVLDTTDSGGSWPAFVIRAA